MKYITNIEKIIKRDTTEVEKSIICALTSEHCSYKTSKQFLRNLFNTNRYTLEIKDEGAGAVKISDTHSLIFKIESHNHPSYIDPFNGASTGVGGILRDVFSMGAKILGVCDAIVVGKQNNDINRKFLENISTGISNYGNCFGVPNLNGYLHYNDIFNKNVLVNAMALGIVENSKIIYSKPKMHHDTIIYVGNPVTGENTDGADMSSKSLSLAQDDAISSADPYNGRNLYDFCMSLSESNIDYAMQDMGAAGISCALFEMSEKANVGIDIFTHAIPKIKEDLTDKEILLSETQERALIFTNHRNIEQITHLANIHVINMAAIGQVNEEHKNVRVFHKNALVVDLPNNSMKTEDEIISMSEREISEPDFNVNDYKIDINDIVDKAIENSLIIDRYNITIQYDKTIGSCVALGADETDISVVKVNRNKDDYTAATVALSCNIDIAEYNPKLAAQFSVCESYRKITSVFGVPLAITNGLNFGKSSDEKIIRQMHDSIMCMNETCMNFDLPIVSGNVSLNNFSYNEDKKEDESIPPVVIIGGIGRCDDIRVPFKFKNIKNDDIIFIISRHAMNSKDLHCTGLERVLTDKITGDQEIDISGEVFMNKFFHSIPSSYIQRCQSIGRMGALGAILKIIIFNRYNMGADIQIADEYDLFNEFVPAYVVISNKETAENLLKYSNNNDVKIKQIGSFNDSKKITTQFGEIDLNELSDKLSLKI